MCVAKIFFYIFCVINLLIGQKSGLLVSKHDSRLEGCGFESHPTLDGNGVKAMPDKLLHPVLVHLIEKKEHVGSQMGHTKIYI